MDRLFPGETEAAFQRYLRVVTVQEQTVGGFVVMQSGNAADRHDVFPAGAVGKVDFESRRDQATGNEFVLHRDDSLPGKGKNAKYGGYDRIRRFGESAKI